MKFRYYITDLYDGKIVGTDDTERAKEFAECEDFFVVDSQEGLWMQPSAKSVEVEQCGGNEE